MKTTTIYVLGILLAFAIPNLGLAQDSGPSGSDNDARENAKAEYTINGHRVHPEQYLVYRCNRLQEADACEELTSREAVEGSYSFADDLLSEIGGDKTEHAQIYGTLLHHQNNCNRMASDERVPENIKEKLTERCDRIQQHAENIKARVQAAKAQTTTVSETGASAI